jgi:hypothetical protein
LPREAAVDFAFDPDFALVFVAIFPNLEECA